VSGGKVVPDREGVLDSITKNDFLEYFNEFKARKAGSGDKNWDGDFKPPYEM
jgi:hypothetical protein